MKTYRLPLLPSLALLAVPLGLLLLLAALVAKYEGWIL